MNRKLPAWDVYEMQVMPDDPAEMWDVFGTVEYDEDGELIATEVVYDRPAYSAPREYSLSDYFAYQQFWLRTQGV